MIPDDMESSPGSTTSLLRTIVGTSLRRLGGWIAVAHLVALAETVGLPEPRTRTALARIKAKLHVHCGLSPCPPALTFLSLPFDRL